MSARYIGSKLSLISNSGQRYEGILVEIDLLVITLTKGMWIFCKTVVKLFSCPLPFVMFSVHCYGTENRLSKTYTPPKDDVFEFITFKVSEIKDLTVSETAEICGNIPDDPAILTVSEVIVSISAFSLIICSNKFPQLW